MFVIKDASLEASVFLVSTAISLAVYTATASKSIAGGDSGELVAEGCALGTSHPPGYPLYTIIVYTVTQLLGKHWYPTLPPAYLVNLASCVFGAISSGLISLVVSKLTKDGDDKAQTYLTKLPRCAAALAAGMMCAFSPLNWQYNTSAEVFALHNLFVSLIVYVLAVYNSQPDSAPVISLGSFLCGLALTNQHTSVLLIAPVACWVAYNSSLLKRPKLLLVSSLAFVAGISLYALLPWMAVNYPHAGSWGDVTTLSGFIHHFLRRDYGTLQLYSGNDALSEGMAVRTLSWAADFVSHQLGYPSLVLLLALGCVRGMQLLNTKTCAKKTTRKKDHRRIPHEKEAPSSTSTWRIILGALVFYLAAFHSLANLPLSNPLLFGIHQRFWMHPNVLAFILTGLVIHKAVVVASNKSTSRALVLSGIVLLLPVIAYYQNRDISNQSANDYFRKYAMSILEPLPKDSLLLINYDQQWTSVRYLQECEGVRLDVTSINLSMMTFNQWWESKHALYEGRVTFPGTHYTRANTLPWQQGGFTFSEFVDANIERSDIFLGGRLNFEDPEYNARYEEQPFGLVRRIQSRDAPSNSAESYRVDSLNVWRTVADNLASDLPCTDKYPQSTWEWTVRREFFDHLVSRSTHLLDLALKEEEQHGVLHPIAEAAAWLELSSSWDSDHFAQKSSMSKNLGLSYMNIVRTKESERYPHIEDIFDDGTSGHQLHRQNWWTGGEGWKEWATTRWQDEWSLFLRLESSQSDPGYSQIKAIYEAVMNSSRAKSGAKSA